MATPRPITFLSDYGYEDEFAGVCRAVISQIAPGASLIDLTHGIARQDVRQGAVALANALPSCPPGVHLAVVDPGVGSERRAVAVAAAEGRILVGPDNGLLSRALDRLGGALDAVELSPLALPPGARLGHLPRPRPVRAGRGAPGAGRAPRRGRRVDRRRLAGRTRAPQPPDHRRGGQSPTRSTSTAIGNVTLDLDASMLADGPLRPGDALEVRAPDGRLEAVWARHLRRRRAGRRAALRGLLRRAGARRQRRQRGRTDGPPHGREVTLRPLK